MEMKSEFLKHTKSKYPIICGAMYPCSNPELIAAVSNAGGIAIVQPITLSFVHDYELRKGIQYIKSLSNKPIGFNLLMERSHKMLEDKMLNWLTIALDEGIRFFVSALGNPQAAVKLIKKQGGFIYHNVTNITHAKKALDAGVDGLIAINDRAGGHSGTYSNVQLYQDLQNLGVPLIQGGGIGCASEYKDALELGFAGVQMGTRFIASKECSSSESYKQLIITSLARDIILTDKISGVPVSVINTDFVKKTGAQAGPLAKLLLANKDTKKYMRAFYSITSSLQMKNSQKNKAYDNYYMAGKSVENISSIESVKDIIESFVK